MPNDPEVPTKENPAICETGLNAGTALPEKVDPNAATRVLPSVSVMEKALGMKPKSNCRHCYGRGYIGTMPTTDPGTGRKGESRVVCRCMKKK